MNEKSAAPQPVKVYFEGRYRKLVRDLPQTVFYCPDCKGRGCDRCEGYGKLTKDSVQELIARVAMPRFKGRRNKFHGAGREDVDVRMLGEGRPFVFEVVKAKRPVVDLGELRDDVNRRADGRIELSELRYCGRRRVVEIKEARHPKDYCARVRFEPAVSAEELGRRLEEVHAQGRIEIIQGTPERVAHRRADLERRRWVELRHCEPEGEDWLLTIRSAHGTYVKEAISGESGRTRPSLSELVGVPCVCRELDVAEILPPEPAAANAG